MGGYLGKTGQCKVGETERGWYVTYIEKDPALLARQEAYERRVEGEKIQEKKLAKRMEVQRVEAEKMLDKIGASVNVIASKMEVRELNETVALKINSSFSNEKKKGICGKRKKSWIRSGILVRIISEKKGCRKYYERKAFINNVHDEYTAVIEILDSGPERRDGGEIIKVDQDNLETVIPKEGKRVCILNGKCRGRDAELIAIDNKKCRATLKLISNDKILKKVDFNDFSKVA